MTDRKALTELLAKVEAGEWVASGDGDDTWLAIFDAGMKHYHSYIYEAWCRKSLNAANAIHEMLLPGWCADIELTGAVLVYELARVDGHDGFVQDNPARAWLIAILKALIAQDDA